MSKTDTNKIENTEVQSVNLIAATEVAELIKKDAFKTVSFIYDLNNNPNNFIVIYKSKLKHQELNATSFYEKLGQICELEDLGFLTFGDADNAKVGKNSIRQALPKVDEIIVDPRQKKGVIKKDGEIIFNKYSEPKMIQYYKNYADEYKKANKDYLDLDLDIDLDGNKINKQSSKFKTVDEHFDFSKCPLWKYHLTRLADPKENKATDIDGNEINSFHYLIKWLAHSFRCDEKIGVAMMLISETHGTGKGVAISKLPQYLFGSDYYSKVNNDTFTDKYNSAVKGKRFINYDESKVDGKDRTVVEEKLKTLITETEVTLREMRKDQEDVASFCNVWVNANYGVPYKLSNSDRRHTVFVTSAIPQRIAVRKDLGMNEKEYLEGLDEQRDEFLKQLFTFEFDWSDVRFNPLNTKAKRRIISGTNTSFDLFVDLARKCDIAGIENICMGLFTDETLEKIIDEVSAGYLSNTISKKVLEELRDSKGSMSAAQQKRFLDEKIGESERIGSKKVTLRKFPHFNQELFNLLSNEETF